MPLVSADDFPLLVNDDEPTDRLLRIMDDMAAEPGNFATRTVLARGREYRITKTACGRNA